MISLNTHNAIDYIFGLILLFSPTFFGFSEISAARNLFLFSGGFLIGYSLLTRYKYSLFRLIPLGLHMSLDALNGALIMLAPWIFGYRESLSRSQELVHYVFAIAFFALVAITKPKAETEILEPETTSSYWEGPESSRDRSKKAG